MEAHRLLRQARLERDGMPPSDVALHSRRLLGNITLAIEESHAMWIPVLAQQVNQDVRYALRGLRRSPGFSLAAISMLAVGLGLVAGGYTVFNGVFLRGLDVPSSEAVFVANARRPAPQGTGNIRDGFSLGAYKHLRSGATSADYVAWRGDFFGLRVEGTNVGGFFAGAFVSDNFIDTLGIPVQRGTGRVTPSPGDPPRILISDAVWRRLFAADPAAIERVVWINDVPAVVAGIVAHEFSGQFNGLGPNAMDVVVDIAFAAAIGPASAATGAASATTGAADDTTCCVKIGGRIRLDQSRTAVQSELRRLVGQYRQSIRQPPLSVAVVGTKLADVMGTTDSWNTIATSLAFIGAGLVMSSCSRAPTSAICTWDEASGGSAKSRYGWRSVRVVRASSDSS
jgi:hypothetical protein